MASKMRVVLGCVIVLMTDETMTNWKLNDEKLKKKEIK